MSRLANEIRSEISSLTQLLTQESLSIDSRIAQLQMRNGICEVGWSKNGPNIALALKDIGYSECHKYFFSNQQYNLILPDGALLQFLYRFEKEKLIEHRVSYMPAPTDFDDNEEFDIASNAALPIRIDFSPDQAVLINHSAAHVHLGHNVDWRIPTSAPITPKDFTLFILRSFYADKLSPKIITALCQSRSAFPESIEEIEKEAIYIKVPSI